MNLMKNLNHHKPVWAPQDDGAGAPIEQDAGGAPPEAGAGDTPPVAAPTPEATQEGADFSFLPDEFRQDGANDIEGFRARFDDLAARDAQREEALADVPEDASGYEFAVPEGLDFGDLDLPENFGFELKADDPALAPVFEEFGGLLHKYNLPKGAAADFMGALAKYRAAEYSPMYAQSKAEMKALGTAAESRVSNIDRVLTARLTADEASALKAATTTANGVKALEKLLNPRGMKQTPATPPPAKTVEDDLADYYNNPTKRGS